MKQERKGKTVDQRLIRLYPEDIQLIDELKEKLGVREFAVVMRMGLRALAEKQSLAERSGS